MRVYKIGDYDWVAANTRSEALAYYGEQIGENGVSEMDWPSIKDCTDDTMWHGFDFNSFKFINLINKNNKEYIIKKGTRDFDMEVKLSFHEVIRRDNIRKPCIIASTEF